MKVKDIIEDTQIINTEYKIENHWHGGFFYQYDSEIAERKVEALLVRDNTLIISI